MWDKIANKRPVLCSLGWHRWYVVESYLGFFLAFKIFRCSRCNASRTEAEEKLG